MKPIPVSSCHNCDPESWIIESDSRGYYRCNKCHVIIAKILRRDYEREDSEMDD